MESCHQRRYVWNSGFFDNLEQLSDRLMVGLLKKTLKKVSPTKWSCQQAIKIFRRVSYGSVHRFSKQNLRCRRRRTKISPGQTSEQPNLANFLFKISLSGAILNAVNFNKIKNRLSTSVSKINEQTVAPAFNKCSTSVHLIS